MGHICLAGHESVPETVHQDGAFVHPRRVTSNTDGNPRNFYGHGKINDTDIRLYSRVLGVFFLELHKTEVYWSGILLS
jgi:hypothetical protein